MFAYHFESDPAPFDTASDGFRDGNKSWTFQDRWDTHFVQGECATDIVLRGICSALFACFVYFDVLQSIQMTQWLYYVPLNKTGAPSERASWFFPDVSERFRPCMIHTR